MPVGGDGEPALGGEGLELLGQRVDRRLRPGNRPPAFVAPERGLKNLFITSAK